MQLLNCSHCDDVLKLVDKLRVCECGRTKGILTKDKPDVSGPGRLIEIDWEQYDGASSGEDRIWRMLKLR